MRTSVIKEMLTMIYNGISSTLLINFLCVPLPLAVDLSLSSCLCRLAGGRFGISLVPYSAPAVEELPEPDVLVV
jgi:hypothetical protein